MKTRVLPEGDRGLLVEYPHEVSPEINGYVRSAEAALRTLAGVVETVPAFRSVLLLYDPHRVAFDPLAQQVEERLRIVEPAPLEAGSLVEVPVVYGGAAGPDLEAVADAAGLSPAEVVRLHSETIFLVYMLGFAPGYPYMGLLPATLRLPRRATPRTRVPAGSVAIADAFCGIYPQETAGGWHLIGRTPLRAFDPGRDPACLLQPGDRVKFVPVAGSDLEAAGPPSATGPVGAVPADGSAFAPHRPVMEVTQTGLLTTIQDAGRNGWRRFGIPPSGPLDRASHRAANTAVGNPREAATIETAFPGPGLRFLDDAVIAIAGADFDARLNGAPIEPDEAVPVRRGDRIEFRAPRRGQWAYVAVGGGIDVPEVFGSRATYARGGLGGAAGRPLRAGDVLGRGETTGRPRGARRPVRAARSSDPIRVILGPQFDAFTVDAQAALVGRSFEVTVQRDRSGMRLRGPRLQHRASAEILSDGTVPGAIQSAADGAPLVLLADGPTTGGYTKIACVIDADLDRLAQAAPGERLRFESVTLAQARAEDDP